MGLPLPGISTSLLFYSFLIPSVCANSYTHSITSTKESRYDFLNGTIRICKPIFIPRFCPKGHEIKPCLQDGEGDRCESCQDGLVNFDITTSDFQSSCYSISCPEGAVLVDHIPDGDCNLPCICDQTAGYVTDIACTCKRVNFKCGPNTYLHGDVCTACPPGTRKPGLGYGPCQQDNHTTNQPPVPTSKPPLANASSYSDNISDVTTTVATDVGSTQYTATSDEKGSNVIQVAVLIIIGLIALLTFCIVVVLVLRRGFLRLQTKVTEVERERLVEVLMHVPASSPTNIVQESKTQPSFDPSHQEIGNVSSPDNLMDDPETSTDIRNSSDFTDTPGTSDLISTSSSSHSPVSIDSESTGISSLGQPCPLVPNFSCINIGMLYAADDEDVVEHIQKEMKELVLKNNKMVKFRDYKHPSFGGSKIGVPRKLTESCDLVLLVVTNHTSDDNYLKFVKNEVIGELITREGRTEFVRPLHTLPRQHRKYSIPEGLTSVVGVDWFGARYKDNFITLLNSLTHEM